ncbi:hypothetical protein FRC09_001408 [Ceratobasidium sp. 395]|nr:hypothetical protein FRC09_001408 [Ceratobasidium sp. 395]
MKRKERPVQSAMPTIRPVLYYPNAADDEPSQVIMPSSPPRSSPSRPSRKPGEASTTAQKRRRSALDNIGYEPENIPTPRAALRFTSTQTSPSKRYAARIQPSSIRKPAAFPQLLSTIHRPRTSLPAPTNIEGTTDADTDPSGSSHYVVDTDEDRTVATAPAFQPPRITAPVTSPFKPTRAFRPPESARPTAQSSPTRPRPDETEIINILDSSDSEPDTTSKRALESPALGTNLSHPEHRSHSVASSEIIVVDPPSSVNRTQTTTTERAPSSSSEDEIEFISFSKTSIRRRIASSPSDSYSPFRSSRRPLRHVPSEIRARGLAPEFSDRSVGPRRTSEERFFRPLNAGGPVSPVRPRLDAPVDRETGVAVSLPPSSPMVVTPTPAPVPEDVSAPLPAPMPAPAPSPSPSPSLVPASSSALSPAPTPEPEPEPEPSSAAPEPVHAPAITSISPPPPVPPAPTRTRRLRLDCVLLPRASRATLSTLVRPEKQRQPRPATTTAKEKGKTKARTSFVVEVPTPAPKKRRGRKSEVVVGGGLGKGKGKGGYAAREEGRWESSSPVRDDDVDVEMIADGDDSDGPDEMDLIGNANEDEGGEQFIVDDDTESRFSSADSEPEIAYMQPKTPSSRKRGPKPGKKKTKTKQSETGAESVAASPARSDLPTPRTKIEMDWLVDLPTSYRRLSLSREVKDTLDKYCHCCRSQKKGKLKMVCFNQVAVARRKRKQVVDEEGMNVCGNIWCQRCILKHGIVFDPRREDFTCPVCDDTCVCDKCRKRRGLEPLGRFKGIRGKRRSSGGGTRAGQDGDDEEEEDAEEEGQGGQDADEEQEQDADEEEEDVPELEHERPNSPAREHTDATAPTSAPNPDSGAKRAGYAELMRQRGPTKWHGRRTPPPLRHRDRAGASTNDVYIPRGPVDGAETESARDSGTVSRAASPSIPEQLSRADTPMETHDDGGPLIVQDALRSFDADYSVDADAALFGPDPTQFQLDADMNGPPAPDEYESGALVMDMEELLLVDQLTSVEPESDAAVNEAILGLGPATHVDDEATLAGLDANLEAARHYYGSQAAEESSLVYEAQRVQRQQLRLRIAPDVMLGSDPNPHLDGFGDTRIYDAGSVGQGYLGTSQSRSLSHVPPALSRPPSTDPYQSTTQLAPAPDPEPEIEPEPVPDLSAVAESAKSTDLETPSPQFGADAGLESANPDLRDLFGGQNDMRLENPGDTIGPPPDEPLTDLLMALKNMVDQKLLDQSNAPDEAPAPADSSLAPTTNVPDPPIPSTSAVPAPAVQTQPQTRSKRRSRVKPTPPADQGRTTRSRSRRTL